MVMIGHSLGGIILRRALDGLRFELGKISVVFWCYVSLASPHLGYLQGTKLLTEMGLQIFSRKKGGKCLDELAMKDWKNE